jgi:hypothetical protein
MLTQLIRSFSTIPKNTIFKVPVTKLNIVSIKLNTNDEDDYNTIQSIIYSYCGAIYYNDKDGKFYFK